MNEKKLMYLNTLQKAYHDKIFLNNQISNPFQEISAKKLYTKELKKVLNKEKNALAFLAKIEAKKIGVTK